MTTSPWWREKVRVYIIIKGKLRMTWNVLLVLHFNMRVADVCSIAMYNQAGLHCSHIGCQAGLHCSHIGCHRY